MARWPIDRLLTPEIHKMQLFHMDYNNKMRLTEELHIF